SDSDLVSPDGSSIATFSVPALVHQEGRTIVRRYVDDPEAGQLPGKNPTTASRTVWPENLDRPGHRASQPNRVSDTSTEDPASSTSSRSIRRGEFHPPGRSRTPSKSTKRELRRCAKITSATWMMTMGPNGVVPIRQARARLEPGPSLVCRPHLPPCGVLLRIQDRPAMESCGRPRPAYVLEHFLVADQWLSGPVAADQAEHPVVDRVPLARSGWVVGHRYHQVKLVRQLLQGDL